MHCAAVGSLCHNGCGQLFEDVLMPLEHVGSVQLHSCYRLVPAKEAEGS